ncbi:TRADD-N-associated membrane domain-containing protein [Pseudonocardia xinjiangensis]|uniref:TRADD-N-associated membrane domain-containing protein n=1 Tax=Pseudonocardia xinjiangensis TaxID=75289 RepID=UPI003D9381BD
MVIEDPSDRPRDDNAEASAQEIAPRSSVDAANGNESERSEIGLGAQDVHNSYVYITGSVDSINFDYSASRERVNEKERFFSESLVHREEFIRGVLDQALRQANMTFWMSVSFMLLGGVIVLAAACLALIGPAGVAAPIPLVSGIGGALIGTCGAAFAVRADRARKHLAEQADKMHSQLVEERKYSQVAELLAGIRDNGVNDKARIALAMRILNGESDAAEPQQHDPGDN